MAKTKKNKSSKKPEAAKAPRRCSERLLRKRFGVRRSSEIKYIDPTVAEMIKRASRPAKVAARAAHILPAILMLSNGEAVEVEIDLRHHRGWSLSKLLAGVTNSIERRRGLAITDCRAMEFGYVSPIEPGARVPGGSDLVTTAPINATD